MKVSSKYKAFTYIEVMIVLGIFSIGAFLLVPLSFSQLGSTRTSYYAADINTFIFSVQQESYTQLDGSAHGIRFNADTYDVYTGSSYATATETLTITMNNDVEITDVSLTDIATSNPTTELVFDRGKFRPNAYGTITVSDGFVLYRVTINREGLSYYEKL